VGAAPEFVESAGEKAPSRETDRGIERVAEPVLHDPVAPAMVAERRFATSS